MNYLAHCVLAQPNSYSIVGNLLGDFSKGVVIQSLEQELKVGLINHRAVDKFTDQHVLIKEAKYYFKREHRRFSGVALDILFDHFLIKHWHLYSHQQFSEYKHQTYQLIEQGYPLMPMHMQRVMCRVVNNDWFESYANMEGICYAIERVANRVRFSNNFAAITEDILQHEAALEAVFLAFFPQLQQHIVENNKRNLPLAAI